MKTVITALVLAATLTSTQAFAGFSSVEEIQAEAQNFCASYASSSETALIRYLGDIVVELDIYRGSVPVDSKARQSADQIRNELDFLQLKLVKKAIMKNTVAISELNASMIQFCK